MKGKGMFFNVLGVLIVLGFFAVLVMLIIRGGAEATVNILIGALAGAFMTVVGYNFGTSRSSAEKTEMLYNSTPLKQPPPV